MILKMYSVYDSKAEAYLPPLFFHSRGEAVRAFTDACNDPKSNISKYPADFTFFELGDFDSNRAKFFPLDTPYSLGLALEMRTSTTVAV